MSPTMQNASTIDAYIALYPPKVQELLQELREQIQKAAPTATETISYGIPTFKLNGNLVHFGAYAHHIGFYPGAEAIEVFSSALSPYVVSKGTVQFQLTEPIPFDLVTKITLFRVSKNQDKKTKQ